MVVVRLHCLLLRLLFCHKMLPQFSNIEYIVNMNIGQNIFFSFVLITMTHEYEDDGYLDSCVFADALLGLFCPPPRPSQLLSVAFITVCLTMPVCCVWLFVISLLLYFHFLLRSQPNCLHSHLCVNNIHECHMSRAACAIKWRQLMMDLVQYSKYICFFFPLNS